LTRLVHLLGDVYLSEESMRLILDAPTELSISLPNDDEQKDLTALAA